jgi:hypothetical protein
MGAQYAAQQAAQKAAASKTTSFAGTAYGEMQSYGGGTTINVSLNAGSIVGSPDALVATVREGILAGQSSGNKILLNPLDL